MRQSLQILLVCTIAIALTLGTSYTKHVRRHLDGYPAWQAGMNYMAGDMVSYSGMNYQVLQSHTSQIGWEPPSAPTLFQPMQQQTTAPQWQNGMSYNKGDYVTYNGIVYIALQAHTSQPDWTPDQAPTLWQQCGGNPAPAPEPQPQPQNEVPMCPASAADWQSGMDYNQGDFVMFNGTMYYAVQAHKSQDDWSPPCAPTLWQPCSLTGSQNVGSGQAVYTYWQPGINYLQGDYVAYNGLIYQCLQAHLSQVDWTPDVSESLWVYICPEPQQEAQPQQQQQQQQEQPQQQTQSQGSMSYSSSSSSSGSGGTQTSTQTYSTGGGQASAVATGQAPSGTVIQSGSQSANGQSDWQVSANTAPGDTVQYAAGTSSQGNVQTQSGTLGGH